MDKTSPDKCPYVREYGRHSFNMSIKRKLALKGTYYCTGCTKTVVERAKNMPEPL